MTGVWPFSLAIDPGGTDRPQPAVVLVAQGGSTSGSQTTSQLRRAGSVSADMLHAGLHNWPKSLVLVQGRAIQMCYQVLGPLVRDELPERPLFLIVVKGLYRLVRKKKKAYKHKGPSF